MAERGLPRAVAPSPRTPEPHAAPAVRLVRMTPAERRDALEREAAEYGEAKARAGFWPHEDALTRARKEIASLVGPDPEAPGHAFFFGVDADGRRVGWVWYGPVPGARTSRGKRWLFQILVEEEFRGRGVGRVLLGAVERRLASEGVRELRLNVFRWNSIAIALYTTAGYDTLREGERSLEMRKFLGRA